jgi:ribosomal protein S18 acetylase RimI-like enzyme
MSVSLTFRRARAADVEAIVALVESAYRGATSRQGWTTEADLLEGQRTDAEEVATLLNSTDSCFLLMERQATLLGNVWLSVHGDCAHLGMFAVRPTEQAQGLGRALLTHAESVARAELGAGLIEMTVIAQRSELIAWYERRGYVQTGEQRPFPYGNARFGLPQRDDLHFRVLQKPLSA